MNIGIDLSPLQGPHRMRGIGSVLLNFINHLPEEYRGLHTFTLYIEPSHNPTEEILDLLNLEGMNYQVIERAGGALQSIHGESRMPKLIKRFGLVLRHSQRLRGFRKGNGLIDKNDGVDTFIQFDQLQSLPAIRHVKKVLVVYDLIPYVLSSHYLANYEVARAKGMSRLASLKYHWQRHFYIQRIRINCRKANTVIAISQHTKDDFIKHAHVKPDKIKVIPLGIETAEPDANRPTHVSHYVPTSWGYSPRPFKFKEDDRFILFVGGADDRRRLDHLVTAFNHLRGQGYKLKLVLAGDTMQGPKSIPTHNIRTSLENSSYIKDVVFMGFVPDSVREMLYERALVFVYPSMYEGFGLPILEAMRYGTPVITYSNSSIPEVAGNAALYASGYDSILDSVKKLLSDKSLVKKYAALGKAQANKFSWAKTSESILELLKN